MSSQGGDDKTGGFATQVRRVAALLKQGDVDTALALSQPVINGTGAAAIYALARTFAAAGHLPESCSMLERCVTLEPRKPEYPLTLANCLAQCQRHRDAIGPYRHAARLVPSNPNILHALAHSLIVAGQAEEAKPLLWQAVNINSGLAAGHYLLSDLRHYQNRGDEHIVLLEQTLDGFEGNARDFSRLAFALGRALDRCGEHGDAFAWIEKANAARKSETDFDIAGDRDLVERVIDAYPEALLEQAGSESCNADWPVLIVGMPRSGSTLVEQILSSHPQVQGAGEVMYLGQVLKSAAPHELPAGQQLPDAAALMLPGGWQRLGAHYAAALRHHDPIAARVVDKQLFNYFDLGAARLMLPDARIIHCVRDPLDTCLSCFFTSFRHDRGFTYDLGDLGESYVLYRRLMQHWESLFPNIHTVRYENLVTDQRGQTEALLASVGLPWDDTCMHFEDNPREVSTSSQVQVRKRIHAGSVGRWKNYRDQLEPLRRILDRGRERYGYA